MNDWILDILIKPDLSKSDAQKVAKRLAQSIKTELGSKDLGSIKVDDKQLTKASKEVLKSLNSVVKELSSNLKSFTKIMKQAQAEAGKAAATTARSVKPTGAAPPPSKPARAQARSAAQASGTTSTPKPDTGVEAAKKALIEKANKPTKRYTEALNKLFSVAEEAAAAAEAEASRAKNNVKQRLTKSVRRFSENVEEIARSLEIAKADPGLVAGIRQYRAPSRNLSERFREESRGFRLPGREELDKIFSAKNYPGADKSTSGFDQLKSALKALSGVARKPGGAPQESVGSLLSELRSLTGPSGVKVPQGKSDQFQSATSNLIKDILRKIVVRLNGEARKAGRAIEQAASEGADPEEMKRLGASYDRAIERLVETLRAIDRGADKHNINLLETARGQTQKPAGLKEEAAFLQAGLSRDFQKELNLDRSAAQAVSIAKQFEKIPDPVKRTQEVFKAIWDRSNTGGHSLLQTVQLVSETLKHSSVRGLLNRRELQEVDGVLESLAKKLQAFKLHAAGVGKGAAHPVIPKELDYIEQGGTTRAYLQRVREIQNSIAKDKSIQRGARIPINIPVETAHGVRNITVEFRKMGESISRVIPKAREMRRALSFRDSIATAFRRVALWGTAAGITYGAANAFREAGRTMMEVETGVVNLSKVVRSADKDLEEFAEQAVASAKRIATEYGTSMTEAFKSMRIFAQQGLEMADVIKLTEATSIAANTTVLDQAKAAEGLTSAIKQFGLEASSSMAIVDAWNEVAKRNAVTELTLVDALKKAGSAARTVGVDFNQLIGLTTAVGEATRQPGKEVGTSLRFIFQRTLRPESAKALSKVGVATKDLEGNFRGFMAVITDLAGRWEELSQGQQLAVAQALGGARQYNAVVALMNNYATAVKASEDALNSQGSAQLENIKVMGTTAKVFAQTKASVEAAAQSLGKTMLPVAKDVASVIKGLVDVFASMPSEVHKTAGALALVTVALSRFAYQADMVMMGGSLGGDQGGGVLAGLGAGLIGRGRQVDPLTQGPKLGGEFGVAAVGISDFSKGAGKELSKLNGIIVNSKGNAVKGAEGFSKMGLAIRGMGVYSAKTGELTQIGFRHMNSPISKLTLAIGKLGKGFAAMGSKISSAMWRTTASMLGFQAASSAASKAMESTKLAGFGLAKSFAGLAIAAVAGYAIYKITKALYAYATARRKTGKETQEDLRSELAKREGILRNLQQQASLIGSLSRQRKGVVKAQEREESGEKSPFKAASADLRRYNLELKSVKLAQGDSIVDPTVIDKFDRFGNAILKVGDSFSNMGNAAIEAQAHLVALTRLKIAKAFARDVEEANFKLRGLKTSAMQFFDVAKLEQESFGGISSGVGKLFVGASREAQVQASRVDSLISNMTSQIKALPKETALFSLEEFSRDEKIMKALEVSIRENNSALEQMGKPAATAVDRLGQLALVIKGFKSIGLTVFETKDLYKEQGIAITSLESVISAFEKTKKRLKGKELVLIDGDNPFGLRKANTALDRSGRLIVEGFNREGRRVEVAFSEFIRRMQDAGKLSSVSIIDPSVLIKQISETVLKVQQKISGASAGLINIPGNLDLGVNFDFQLGDVDRLQKAGSAASESIVAAFRAQQKYNSSIEDFKKSLKSNYKAEISKAASERATFDRAVASALNHMLKFASVLESVGNSFAKASHELNKSYISDKIESEFGSVYGTISGYSEKLTAKLPKTLEELSPDERFAKSNPELVAGIRAGQRTMERLKAQIVAMEQLSGGDIQKMFESFTNQDQKIFTSALEQLGGDLKGATMVTQLSSIARINSKGFSNLTRALTGQPSKKDAENAKKDQIKASERTVESLSGQFSKYIESDYSLQAGGLSKKGKEQAERERERALLSLGVKTPKAPNLFQGGGIGGVSEAASAAGALVLSKSLRDDFKSEVKREVKDLIKSGADIGSKEIRSLAGRLSASSLRRAQQADARTNPLISEAGERVPGPLKLLGLLSGRSKLPTAQEYAYAGLRDRLKTLAFDLKKISEGGDLSSKQETVLKALSGLVNLSAQQGRSKLQGINAPQTPGSAVALTTVSKAREAAYKKAQNDLAIVLEHVKKKGKELQRVLLGMSEALGFVGKRVQSFLYDVSAGVDKIKSGLEVSGLTRGIRSPIAGELAGVNAPNVQLGKLKGTLSPLERVSKRYTEYTSSISDAESARVQAVSLFSEMATKLVKVRKDIKGLLTGGEELANRDALLRIQSKSESLFVRMREEMSRVNRRMAPFIESLTKMVRIEQARKNIEGIINALKKAEDLQFDTTSIDVALGKHPLSRVSPQFGEPAGLNKFQQQLFQLEQKRKAGTISGQDFSYEKKKIGFQKEEALIQYKQTKENSKLRSEIESARRAMGVLWDAQSQGIGGVGGLIETLKRDLSSAGDVVGGSGGALEFKGVPSLFGIDKELAKVQEAVKEKNFELQRNVVMAPLEALQQESNKLQAESVEQLKVQTKALKERSDSVTGRKSGSLAGAVKNEYEKLKDDTVLILRSSANSLGKALVRASEFIRAGTDEHVPKIIAGMQYVSAGFDSVGKNVVRLAKQVQSVATSVLRGTSIPGAIPGGPTATPPRKAAGGIIVGPGGIDNVPAMLTAGEYVIPKHIVDKYGVNYFNKLISGGVQGFKDGGPVGGGLSSALSVIVHDVKQYVDELNKVTVRSIPLALAEAGRPEKMPAYVAEALKKTSSKTEDKIPSEEQDFILSVLESKLGKVTTKVSDKVQYFSDPQKNLSGQVGAGFEAMATTVKNAVSQIDLFSGVITKVKDNFISFGNVTTKVKDDTMRFPSPKEFKEGQERLRKYKERKSFEDMINKGKLNIVGQGGGDRRDFEDMIKKGRLNIVGQGSGKLNILDQGVTGPGFNASAMTGAISKSLAETVQRALSGKIGAEEKPAVMQQIERARQAAGDIYRKDVRLGGQALPSAFRTEEEISQGASTLAAGKESGLPAEYQELIGVIKNASVVIGSTLDNLPPVDKIKKGTKQGEGTSSGSVKISEDSLAILYDTIKAALKEGVEKVEVEISKASLLEVEESVRRGAAAISDAIAQAAPTASGGKGSLGAAVKSDLDQLNGRADALNEKMSLQNNALQTNLNERFDEVEKQVMREIKKIYDSKFTQTDTKIESVIDYVRRVESITHSINSRVGDQ